MTTTKIAALTWLLRRENGSTEPAPRSVTLRTWNTLRTSTNYVRRNPETHAFELTEAGRAAAKDVIENPPVEVKRAARAECQVCEGQQAIDRDGRMVHHGYKRPGCGWIVGDCMGVRHLPFPETDALEAYLPRVMRFAEVAERRAIEPGAIGFTVGYTEARSWGERSKEIRESFDDFEAYEARCAVLYETASPSIRSWFSTHGIRERWDGAVRLEKLRWESEARNARVEEKRVRERIAKGRALRGEVA